MDNTKHIAPWNCVRCGKDIWEKKDRSIATFDDGRKESVCQECIIAVLGPNNEEWEK